MGNFGEFWMQGDAVARAVALLLLAMSISAWVLILWKAWTLQRARRDIERGVAAFWAAPDLEVARRQLQTLDRDAVLQPLVDAAATTDAPGTLAAGGDRESQLTRRLRDALHEVLQQLQFGQVVLASVGATAPFVGLFGTVWGIYHALVGITAAGNASIDKVSGPVGEALIMTAAGLAVAIPAVLAYNVFGRLAGTCEAALEGFAHDLRELALGHRADRDEA
ncbi:MotA/TolQ/ExbB proton channel family protein [Rivibacter subsaxonicus]|uniref:Biopolymer transport protein ExbB n=1 Tax=Rivibacter subsaxonicus TaxID=457575 RepID=A0A4Q7VVG6_9BURK|nr:MotA/TolQ/ExbB proton channel family protein [Rivibacter subsaxonicus]RZU00662.1 biopolymer transport protein ExbB [Rivibacter subsaxonicus]